MAKKLAPVEVNSFVGGLISDANALTFPPNASLAEDNMVLNSDGSRNRRLGMDFESDAVEITTTMASSATLAHTTFKWENAGGDPEKTLLAVQFGNELKFYDFDNIPLSSSVVYTHTFEVASSDNQFSYAVVDGLLIVVTGSKAVTVFTYDVGTITAVSHYLKIRDMFGVEDVVDSVDLLEGNNITTRPSTTNDTHTYNLRNQSWGRSYVTYNPSGSNNLDKKDPIVQFQATGSKYPSNADAVNQAFYADANLTDGRTLDRFFVADLEKNPLGTSRAAPGYFIIDALERGTSRLAVYAEMMAKYPQLTINISSLPLDKTEGGASCVAQFAGRVWYGGFSGEVVSGDKKSPRLSSYVMFSRLVQDPTDINKCYQSGDPTSRDETELVDTDGGFIRIDEAFGIKAFRVAGNSLFALAQNGVWRITGGSKDEGFTATNYTVNKVSEVGCIGPATVVAAEGAVFFWGEDGIYSVGTNEYGDWIAKSLVQNRIQNFYNDISAQSKVAAQGFYDSYEHKIRWVYDNILVSTDSTREIVFDLQLGAFYTNTLTTLANSLPKLTGIYEAPSFRLVPGTDTVVAGSDIVMVGVNEVTVGVQTRESATREIGYIVVTSTTSTVKYKFSTYKDTNFLDWKSHNAVGVDAAAYMITGYLSGGDAQRQKQAPMLTVYCKKTETGFDASFNPVNQSSVKMQVQWEWTNSANSNRWGTEFQAYRHRKHYFPETVDDTFDNGYEVIVTKNKVRGKGRVLSMKFRTEPGRDFHVLGWSFMLGIMTDV